MNILSSFSLSAMFMCSFAAAQVPYEIAWQKCIGGAIGDGGRVIRQTVDGDYIIAAQMGFSGEGGALDYDILKIDQAGEILWQVNYGGSDHDQLEAMELLSDGSIVVAGYVYSSDGDVTGFHGSNDMWIIKLDSAGQLIWQKCLGGTGLERAYAIVETTDGGITIAGEASAANGDVSVIQGSRDAWIVKLDGSGEILWERSYGGSMDDLANSIVATQDGGYIIAAETFSNDGDVVGQHGQQDVWVVKLDATGNIEWKKCLGGTGPDIRPQIIQASDGGYLIGCESSSNNGDVSGNHGYWDLWFAKLDPIGALQWQYSAGGSESDILGSFFQEDDGGYIVHGSTFSNDGDVSGYVGIAGPDAWLFRFDPTGTVQWQQCFGGTGSDAGSSVQATLDNGLVLVGSSNSNDGDVSGNNGGVSDIWVVKLGATATILQEVEISPFQLFPNPTIGQLSIQLASSITGSIAVHDAMGRELLRSAMNGNSHQFDLSDRPKGVYLLTLQTAQGVSSQRLVLK